MGCFSVVLFAEFYQAEVEHFYCMTAAAVWLEPDVIRLKISVNDPGAMRFFNTCTNLLQDIDGPVDRQGAFLCNDLCQRAAIEILHHEVGHWTTCCLRDSEIGDVDNVWVAQSSGGFGLTSKPRDKLIVR